MALDDLTVAEAVDQVDDPSWFYDLQAPILAVFSQVTVEGYWQLTVGDHRRLAEFLESHGRRS